MRGFRAAEFESGAVGLASLLGRRSCSAISLDGDSLGMSLLLRVWQVSWTPCLSVLLLVFQRSCLLSARSVLLVSLVLGSCLFLVVSWTVRHFMGFQRHHISVRVCFQPVPSRQRRLSSFQSFNQKCLHFVSFPPCCPRKLCTLLLDSLLFLFRCLLSVQVEASILCFFWSRVVDRAAWEFLHIRPTESLCAFRKLLLNYIVDDIYERVPRLVDHRGVHRVQLLVTLSSICRRKACPL